MREHDAAAYAQALLEHCPSIMRRHMPRTDGRTDGLTQSIFRNRESFRNASRAGGLKDSSTGSTQNTARRPDSRTSTVDLATFTALRSGQLTPAAVVARSANAQSFAGRPLASEVVETSLTASSPLTRRVSMLNVGTDRHHPSWVACSPMARWRGRSGGSNPLRPPTSLSTADRCKGSIAPCRNSKTAATGTVDNNGGVS